MFLLNIPTEILDLVVQFYVNEVGVANAWCRRDVCKTFKSVIEYEVLARQPGEAFGHVFTGFAKLVLTHSHRMQYLRYRLKQSNCDRPIFAPRLIALNAELTENLEEKEGHLQEQLFMTLCNVVATVNANILEFNTFGKRGCKDDAVVSNADRIAAAVSLGDNHSLQKLIIDHPGDIIKKSTALGYPLEAAVIGPQMALLKVLLNHLPRIEPGTYESDLVAESIHGAIKAAETQEVIEFIINFIKEKYDHNYANLVQLSWNHATDLGDYSLIKLIYDNLPQRQPGNYLLSSYSFHNLHRHGFGDIVRGVAKKGYLLFASDADMKCVIFHGQADLIPLLVECHCPVNTSWGIPDISPLSYAVSLRQTAAVKLLLEHGADINIDVDKAFRNYMDRKDGWKKAEADIRELVNAARITSDNLIA